MAEGNITALSSTVVEQQLQLAALLSSESNTSATIFSAITTLDIRASNLEAANGSTIVAIAELQARTTALELCATALVASNASVSTALSTLDDRVGALDLSNATAFIALQQLNTIISTDHLQIVAAQTSLAALPCELHERPLGAGIGTCSSGRTCTLGTTTGYVASGSLALNCSNGKYSTFPTFILPRRAVVGPAQCAYPMSVYIALDGCCLRSMFQWRRRVINRQRRHSGRAVDHCAVYQSD